MKNFNLPIKLKYREKRVKTLLSQLEIFKRIEEKYPFSVFLESMEKKCSEARYSTICFSPYLHIVAKDNFLIIEGEQKRVENPYNELKKITKKLQQRLAEQKLPGGFCGGLIGYLSYEAAKYFEPAFRGKKNKNFFDFEFGLYLDGLVFDNKLKTIKYFYLGENRFDLIKNGVEHPIECSTPKPFCSAGVSQERTPANSKDLLALALESPSGDSSGVAESSDNTNFTAEPLGDDIKEEEYKNLVKRAKENIVDGEVFQLIVSREYKYKISGNLLGIYERLRKINPSPHMFFLRFADRYLIGSFPELVVQMENGVVKNFPIAGTRYRGKNATEDKEIAKGLLKDEKELAEHMMLIDLGRNDLGRICEFGSVKVAKKMIIKKFSHVMHICSEIHGEILKNKDMFDALAVSMPMGTVSGAPKVRAMELIDKYEKTARGPYAGSIGYFSLNGDCKLTAGLRAIFISNGVGSIRAGGGIVYDSKPDYEFNETENKMRGMRRVAEK